MHPSDLALFAIHLDALYIHDAAGRIHTANEPDGARAPRFFLGLTREGNLWRCRYDLPVAAVRRLEALAAAEPVHTDLRALPSTFRACQEVLGDDPAGRPEYFGPVYRFPTEIPPPDNAIRITRANLDLLRSLPAYFRDIAETFAVREPVYAVVREDMAVSLCYSSRLTDRAAEAGTESLPAYRGQGHATACVAAWARAVRAGGRIPFYGTTWDNLASQGVARKLGLIEVGADFSL
jgi:RimJ/RimL family protein N-acetyltransferase